MEILFPINWKFRNFHRTAPGHCTSIAPIAHQIRTFAAGTFREQRVEEGKITVFLRAHFAVFVQVWLSIDCVLTGLDPQA